MAIGLGLPRLGHDRLHLLQPVGRGISEAPRPLEDERGATAEASAANCDRRRVTRPAFVDVTDHDVDAVEIGFVDLIGQAGPGAQCAVAVDRADQIACARAAVRAKPDLFEPFNQLAWLLTINEPTAPGLAEAVASAGKAVRLAEDDSERASGLDTLGWALFCAGQINEAVGVLGEAVRMDGYDVMLRSHLADARAAATSPESRSASGQQGEPMMQAVGRGASGSPRSRGSA